jgi:hypothetical protein
MNPQEHDLGGPIPITRSFHADNRLLVDTSLALSEELCLIAIDRYTILEADRKPFPKASDNIAEPGKGSTDPELIEQLCELIDELPEGQHRT